MPGENLVRELQTLARRDGRSRRVHLNLALHDVESLIKRATAFRSMIAEDGLVTEWHYAGPDAVWYNEDGDREVPVISRTIIYGERGPRSTASSEIVRVAWQAQFARNDSFYRTLGIEISSLVSWRANRLAVQSLAPAAG